MVDVQTTRTEKFLRPKMSFISSICTLPLHRNKSFLHENYIEKGLSLRQISALCFSSKTAVREALLHYNIPLRDKSQCHKNPAYPKFGKKKVKGKIVDYKKELQILETIKSMYITGNSTKQIATFLNQMKVPTKQQGKKWYGETIRYILIREGVYKKK